MALSGAALSALIKTELQDIGFSGVELDNFSNALGNGIVDGSSGILTFTTADVGNVPGNGVGSGTGVTGMVESSMAGVIFSTGQGFWSSFQNNGPGVKWQDLCDAVSAAVVAHFSAAATLTSTHSPVFDGVGTVTVYAGVTIPVMKAAIEAAAPASWLSHRFPELAEAVATGVVTELTTHSPADVVAISGTFTGSTPPGPVPGAGSGSGVVT